MRDLDLRSGRRALLVLLAVDGALLAVHIVQRIVSGRDEEALLAATRLSLSTERGVGELFGYGQTALVIALLLLLWRASGRAGRVYIGWAVVFTTVLLDDSLQVHEAGGRFVVRHLDGEVAGLDPEQLGELMTWALLSLLPLLLVAVLHRTSPRPARQRSWVLGALVGALIFFGAGVDTLHDVVDDHHTVAWLVGSVEDGGELLVMSLIAAFAVAMAGTGVRWGHAPARDVLRSWEQEQPAEDGEPAARTLL